MTEREWYERTEELLHRHTANHWDTIVDKAVEAFQSLFPDSDRTEKQVREILDGLLRKLQGFPPPWLVIAGPDGEILTPDDMAIHPAHNEMEIEQLWDLHDGRSLGTLVVAVYRWSAENGQWIRDLDWGMMGDPRKKHRADPDVEGDRLA